MHTVESAILSAEPLVFPPLIQRVDNDRNSEQVTQPVKSFLPLQAVVLYQAMIDCAGPVIFVLLLSGRGSLTGRRALFLQKALLVNERFEA